MRLIRSGLLMAAATLSLAFAGPATGQTAEYEIAFASFAPLNADIFIADGQQAIAPPPVSSKAAAGGSPRMARFAMD